MRWVEGRNGALRFWMDMDARSEMYVDELEQGGYVVLGLVTEMARVTVKHGEKYPESTLDRLAGPFDTLEAAQAACLLIGAE